MNGNMASEFIEGYTRSPFYLKIHFFSSKLYISLIHNFFYTVLWTYVSLKDFFSSKSKKNVFFRPYSILKNDFNTFLKNSNSKNVQILVLLVNSYMIFNKIFMDYFGTFLVNLLMNSI